MDLEPEERFVEVATALKPQILIAVNDYMHLAPGFVRSFFKDDENVIKLRHLEYYREIVGIAKVLEVDSSIILMMNYAFELGDALCTSVVARQADGTIIAARNLDFAFADAVRNITFKAEIYKKGVHIYDSVTFAGFVGIFTAHKANKFTISLNARGLSKSIETYYEIMSEIYVGVAEIAMAARDIVEACDDYACLMSTIPDTNTVVPMYFIIGGT